MEEQIFRQKTWSDYRFHGNVAYRIWIKKTPHGNFQRHEWRRVDEVDVLENWIPTAAEPDPRFEQVATVALHPIPVPSAGFPPHGFARAQ